MDEDKLRSIIGSEIRTAVGFVDGDISNARKKAMEYYMGDPFGNEIEGRSSVVSTDVQDTIESMMPDFMEIFSGGDTVVRFNPTGPEDEETALQATDYINYIWNSDNEGFVVTHDAVKDALLQRNAVFKIWWDESEQQKRESYEGLNTLDVQTLQDDETVEIIEYESRPAPTPDGLIHDLTIIRTLKKGRVKVICLPPEEFLISSRAESLDAQFTCHKARKTVSDLIEEGYDREQLEKIPDHDTEEHNEERQIRFERDELDDEVNDDPSMREIWLYECYIKVDFDDDGIAETRKVTVAGSGYEILKRDGKEENLEVDEHPFVSFSSIRMPHKFFGRAVADLVMDVQLIKSTIQRQLLDNMYNVNNARSAINERVDLDDYLTNRPGGAVRIEGNGPVGDSIMPITTQPLGPQAFNQLEYWDGVREMRTGVTRMNQGLDADSLNKTASGMNQLLGRTQRRMLLIARIFSEMGFKPAFRKILKIITMNQDSQRVIRLRNKWVPMDPKHWNADMDATVSVGLGYGTKEQQVTLYRMFLEMQEKIIMFQGGVQGPLVTLQNVHHTLKKFAYSAGERDADQFFSDPQTTEPPPPKPDPEMMKLEQEMKLAMAKLQAETQVDMEKIKFQYAEMHEKYRTEDSRQALKEAELAVDAAQTAAQQGIDRVEANARMTAAKKGNSNEKGT